MLSSEEKICDTCRMIWRMDSSRPKPKSTRLPLAPKRKVTAEAPAKAEMRVAKVIVADFAVMPAPVLDAGSFYGRMAFPSPAPGRAGILFGLENN